MQITNRARNVIRCALLMAGVLQLCLPPHARAQLTLDDAERLALSEDPAVIAADARASALRDEAVAEGQLPDPKLGLGLVNVPLDDFSISREPMTQFTTRVEQAFPRGDTLRHRQQMTQWLSEAESEHAALARREILRDVRQVFLELYYQEQAGRVVAQSRVLFEQLVEVTRAHFASGRVSQQDVLQAHLELSRLDDRATRIRGEIDEQRAQLTRWLGKRAWAPVESGFPALPALPPLQVLQESLPQHPAIASESARLEAGREAVRAAREQYKPGWNAGIEYRKRFGDDPDGSERPDMMAAMLTVELPLFTAKRQDRRLAASRYNAEAARQTRLQRLRELRRSLEQDHARWKRLGEQETLYRERLVAEARDSAQAALNAYQSGTSDFTALLRARLDELDIRLQDSRIRVDRAKAEARLLYLAPASADRISPTQGDTK